MSIHLTERAAEVKLPPSLKLALMCFADSGTNDGRIAMPGIDGLMMWCGVGRSQAFRLVKRLAELELIAVHQHGYRGRRSEYVVFPNGCCDRHGKVPAELRVVADVAAEKGSHPCDSTAYPQGRIGCDPIAEKGSHSDPGKGRISAAERVASSRSNLEPSKSVTPKPTPGSHLPASTHLPPISLELRNPDCSMPNCHVGWLSDVDGLPAAPCPHCTPTESTRGATA